MPEPHAHLDHALACHDLLAQFSAYVDGDAPPALCAAIEQHCATCADCQTVLTTLAATVRLSHALPAPALPAAVAARLAACLQLDLPDTP